ncbi:hypothetical protein [Gordonia sp. CPCC 205333]|uniref:hypothetical protein n=1 Tax=Gordonia sp. CPCC 205333 TaxID=3140790 RepID=UPI003AF33730
MAKLRSATASPRFAEKLLAITTTMIVVILVVSILDVGRPTAGQPYANQTDVLVSWLDSADNSDKVNAPFTVADVTTRTGRNNLVVSRTVNLAAPPVEVLVAIACFSPRNHAHVQYEPSFKLFLDEVNFAGGLCAKPPVGPSPIKDRMVITTGRATTNYPTGQRTFTARIMLPRGGLIAASLIIRHVA